MPLINPNVYELKIDEVGRFSVLTSGRPGSHPVGKLSDAFFEIFQGHELGQRTGLISIFAPSYEISLLSLFKKEIQSTQTHFVYMSHENEDATAPTIESLERFRKKIFSLIKIFGNKPAIHCGSGLGRCGTMVASLFIYQKIQETNIDNLEQLMQPVPYAQWSRQLQISSMSGEDIRPTMDIKNCLYSEILVQALDFVKNKGLRVSKNSVEHHKQALALEHYASILVDRKTQTGELKDTIKDISVHTSIYGNDHKECALLAISPDNIEALSDFRLETQQGPEVLSLDELYFKSINKENRTD